MNAHEFYTQQRNKPCPHTSTTSIITATPRKVVKSVFCARCLVNLENTTTSIVSAPVTNAEGFSRALALARKFHATYEKNAVLHGWKTQEACQTDFDDLPPQNKTTMLVTCAELLEEMDSLRWKP